MKFPDIDGERQAKVYTRRTAADCATEFLKIDHIALAVSDLEAATHLFQNILGFELRCKREIKGARTGMKSVEFEHNGIRFVLCMGTEPESQVSRLVDAFGVGVAHIAFEVNDVDESVDALKSRGLQFDTEIIRGAGLTQSFSSRDTSTGLSFEFINRNNIDGFEEDNVQALFNQLEDSSKF